MRKLTSLTMVLISSIRLGLAQVEHHFIDTNSVWCVSSGYYTGFSTNPYAFFSYRARFDLISESDTLRIAQGYEDTFIEYPYDQKVYIQTDSGSVLIYDFTLQVGDTFWWHDSLVKDFQRYDQDTISYIYSVVADIDSVSLYDGTKRMRINFESHFYDLDSAETNVFWSPTGDMAWIDGIGSTLGWYYPKCGWFFESHFYFSAFFQDTTLLLAWRECYPVGIDESKLSTVKAWPNPVNDILYLESLPAKSELQIFDMLGRSFLVQKRQENSVSVDTKFLNPGLNVLIVTDESSVQTFRIIKE